MGGKNKKTDFVIESLLDYMTKNQLREGDKLPSEEELTASLGVSRISVREGLRGLKFLGLLKSSTSRGTMIQPMDFSLLTRCLGFQVALDDSSFAALLETRLVLELGIIEQLCGKLTEEQVIELEACADCKRNDDSPEEIERDIAMDRKFHRLLFQFSGNPVLESFAKFLEIFFSGRYPRKAHTGALPASHEHHLLLKALKDGNLELARGVMKMHIMKYKEVMAKEKG